MVFVGLRAAAEEVWGKAGLAAVSARMPAEVRERVIAAPVFAATYLPERYVLAWCEAAWAYAGGNEAEYRRFVDRMIDHGFGKVRSLMLRTLSPRQLFGQVAKLWRHDHTTGELTAASEGRTTTVVLSGHPYCEQEVTRLFISECFRYINVLSRRTEVRAVHSPLPTGALEVKLTWG